MKFLLLLLFCLPAMADPRYCGPPDRNADGSIKRDRAELRKFAKRFPCPVDMRPVTQCKGWSIDHVIPLASGGCDKQINMQWLPNAIKSCAGKYCKDRWERKYHDKLK